MRFFLQKCLISFLLTGILGTAWVGAQSADEVLVKATGWQILRRDLDTAFKRQETELLHMGRILSEEEESAVRRQLLEQMIFTKLCLAKANAEDRETAKKMARDFVEDLKKEFGADGLLRMLTRVGHTGESFDREKLEEATVSAVIERTLRPTIRIPTSDVREFYEAYADRFEDPAVARAHILVLHTVDMNTGMTLPPEEVDDKRRIGRRLVERARGSEDFLELIQRYSDDPTAKATRGETRFMRGGNFPEVEAAAFSMKPGQISDLISTDFGFCILRLNEVVPAKVRPFSVVSEDIRELLVQRELELRIPEYAQQLREEQKVEMTATAKAL